MLRTRQQQQEQQQRSASLTGVQQQMRAELEQLFLRAQRQTEPLDHIARACKLVWQYSNLRLAERTLPLEQGPQAQAREVLSDDEECQGSDADESSSDEDSSSDEE